jgi:hypothetical protein
MTISVANISLKRENYARYLNDLWHRALKARPFDTVCTLLRVQPPRASHWDPFLESFEAFQDLDWLFQVAVRERSPKCSLRIAIVFYCQVVEMTALHEMLANLVRCSSGQSYIIDPFHNLVKRKKHDHSAVVSPPSAKRKFDEIKKLAESVNESELIRCIAEIYDTRIRNAVSHGDYILTENSFRSPEGGFMELKITSIENTFESCFGFYGAFLDVYETWLKAFAQMPRYHKWPEHSVLELISDQEMRLYGFRIHFSNGSSASFSRTERGVNGENLFWESDGSMNWFVGDLNLLEPVWKINGEVVTDWKKIKNVPQGM